jgi:hypothetical protein
LPEACRRKPPVEDVANKKTSIIFDAAFQGRAAGAVWIVDSAKPPMV